MTDAETERKAIVAWLRARSRQDAAASERDTDHENAIWLDGKSHAFQWAADAIERSAHLNPETHNEG